MATIPFALSIHHFVSSVGADAGFAAIIGLAILVLLFFSQARETSALRRRAEDAEDVLEHLELRLNSLSRSSSAAPAPASPAVVAPPAAARLTRTGVTPAPASAAGSAAVPAMAGTGAGGLATIPAAPAGVGAPALSSATRLIPLGPGEEISIRPLHPGEEPGGPDEDADGERAANGNGTGAARLDAPPPPSTPAGGAARSAPAGASRPVAAPAAEGIGSDSRAASRGLPPRPAALPPRREAIPGPRQWRRSRVAIVLALAVTAIAVVAVLVAVLGSGGSSPSSGASRRSSATRASTRRARGTTAARPIVPSSVQVAVLNGTSTPNLAHDVMAKLTALGYRQAVAPATASNQTLTQTVVGYAAAADRPQALAVARSLGLVSGVVRPVSSSDRTVACSATPTSCPAQVFVTVGSDLSSLG
jgi:hypothetical protein